MFVFDVLSGRVGSPNLLSLVNVIAPRYRGWMDGWIKSGSQIGPNVHHTDEKFKD
jgi:hypothetical protein